MSLKKLLVTHMLLIKMVKLLKIKTVEDLSKTVENLAVLTKTYMSLLPMQCLILSFKQNFEKFQCPKD